MQRHVNELTTLINTSFECMQFRGLLEDPSLHATRQFQKRFVDLVQSFSKVLDYLCPAEEQNFVTKVHYGKSEEYFV